MNDCHTYSGYSKVSDIKKLDFILNAVNKEMYRVGKCLSILEVGCGTGHIARPLASLGHNVLATDVDEESIRYVQRKPIPISLDVAVLDARYIPPTIGPFQVVVCSEVLEHLKSPNEALCAIKNILAYDGLLIVTVPNGYGPWEIRNLLIRKIKKMLNVLHLDIVLRRIKRSVFHDSRTDWSTLNPFTPHVQFFTFNHFRSLLKECGFEVEKIRHSNFILPALPFMDRVGFLDKIDCGIADRLPTSVVSGWYVTARITNNNSHC